MMKIREQIPTATVSRRDVVIASASLAFLATLSPAIHAAGIRRRATVIQTSIKEPMR
jgi:hypothetical protein